MFYFNTYDLRDIFHMENPFYPLLVGSSTRCIHSLVDGSICSWVTGSDPTLRSPNFVLFGRT